VAVITDPEGARSYPIVTYTWLLLRRENNDPDKAAALKDLVKWALTEGQRYAESLRYVPLPDNVAQAALDQLK
jgi:phosphate transport system substrate-binding protein